MDCADAGSDSASQAMARNRREVIFVRRSCRFWLAFVVLASEPNYKYYGRVGKPGPQVVTLPLSSTKVGSTMKSTSVFAALVVSFGLAAGNADAAKRFGGGGNVGKQRPAPTATKEASASPTPSQAAPAATPASPPPKPSFMSRWGGMLAGLGIGVLLASLFGAQMGPIVGLLLGALLIGFIGCMIVRLIVR